MGGVWERMIGTTRRILDGIVLQHNIRNLTHKVLSTLMAEVTAVINSRPITTISSDPDSPIILSPNILLAVHRNKVKFQQSQENSLSRIYTPQTGNICNFFLICFGKNGAKTTSMNYNHVRNGVLRGRIRNLAKLYLL